MKDVATDGEGFVLAGGQSSRMGQDKALVMLAGKPLVEHALAVLRATRLRDTGPAGTRVAGAGLSARIAGARSDLSRFAPVVPDDAPDLGSSKGPLSGVCSALHHATAEWAVFVSVDQPLMTPSLLTFMLEHARLTGRPVTLVSLNGFAQTFPAVVRRDALAVLLEELHGGRPGCFAGFKAAGVSVICVENVVQTGHVVDARGFPPYVWFRNVNTPEDLAAAGREFRCGID